ASRPEWAAATSARARPPSTPTRCSPPAPSWRSPARRSRAQRVAIASTPPRWRRTAPGTAAAPSVLHQPGPQPKSDRDGRAQAEHDATDRRAGQPLSSVEHVVAQLVTTLLHRLDQRTVEFVEGGRGVVLAATQRDLSGGAVITNRDVGIDPVIGPAPLIEQLVGALQIALVDGVTTSEIFIKLFVHGIDAFVEGLLADLFVPAPNQGQGLVGTCLLRTDGQIGNRLQ